VNPNDQRADLPVSRQIQIQLQRKVIDLCVFDVFDFLPVIRMTSLDDGKKKKADQQSRIHAYKKAEGGQNSKLIRTG
jgi:hypothetical protein